jgi:hypothetical protein
MGRHTHLTIAWRGEAVPGNGSTAFVAAKMPA